MLKKADVVARYILVLVVSMVINGKSIAQEPTKEGDSTKLYSDIDAFSRRSKFTRFIHHLIFKPVSSAGAQKDVQKMSYNNRLQKPYSTFEGKIIRKINIITLDPFKYSSNDTIKISPNFLERAGNATHVKSKARTIRNLLLFSEDQSFDALLVRESERLIRSQKYVQEVSFFIAKSPGGNDSVDIVIREIDKWSIIPNGSISSKGMVVSLKEMNFLGYGHEFDNTYSRDFVAGINAYAVNYFVPNIRDSYVNARIHYALDGYGNYQRNLVFDRPFFSSAAKWAGGAALFSQGIVDSIQNLKLEYIPIKYILNTQDYWASKSFHIFKSRKKDAFTTNAILTLRFLRSRYFEDPSEWPNPMAVSTKENFYLGGIGVSNREYVQDKNIFKFGVVEDVPIGRAYGLFLGYQKKNELGRYYVGVKISNGNQYHWGNLTSHVEFGTFLYSGRFEQGGGAVGLSYFTKLFEFGRWRMRQFAKPEVTIGINRLIGDSLTLNDGNGLNGFTSFGLSGTNRMMLTLQTQAYSPWNLIGFHFGPYLIYSVGMLGNAEGSFKRSKAYSQIGIGVMIKNMNLVFNTFQISLSFYPHIPGMGMDIFKVNSFSTADIGFSDFVIGKPAPFVYQ